MKAVRALLAAGTLVCAAAAPAQIVIDNELRAQMLALVERLNALDGQIEHQLGQVDRLQTENQQLRRLVAELSEAVDEANLKAAGYQQRLDKFTRDYDSLSAEEQAQLDEQLGQVQEVIEGLDAAAYEQALSAYFGSSDVAAALGHLQTITALGGMSSYTPAARYWTGKINYDQGELRTARNALSLFLKEHAGDAREPDALLLLAEIATLLGDESPQLWEQRLLRDHPASAAADRVRKLKGL